MKRFRLKNVEVHNKEPKEASTYVAEGIQFSNGTCALTWITTVHSVTAIYESIEAVEFMHGLGGKTTVEWVDNELKGIVDNESINCSQCDLIITDNYSLISTSNRGERRFFCNRKCYANWCTNVTNAVKSFKVFNK